MTHLHFWDGPTIVSGSSDRSIALQSCYASVCSSFTRVCVGSSSITSSHEVSTLQLIADTLQTSFRYGSLGCVATCISMEVDGTAMYMGYIVTLLNACLFEERRDRIQTLHVLLLARLLSNDGFHWGIVTSDQKDNRHYELPETGFIGDIRYILNSLLKMSSIKETIPGQMEKRFCRSIAASFPTAVAALHKLISKCTLAESSTWASIIKKITEKQLRDLFEITGPSPTGTV